jgi:hypothetical protein
MRVLEVPPEARLLEMTRPARFSQPTCLHSKGQPANRSLAVWRPSAQPKRPFPASDQVWWFLACIEAQTRPTLGLPSGPSRLRGFCVPKRADPLRINSANGTFVALQAECDDLEMIGLALLYPALEWSSIASGPSWISAHIRSHSERGPERPLVPPDHGCDGETASPSPQSNSQTSAGSFSFAWWCQGSALRLNPSA